MSNRGIRSRGYLLHWDFSGAVQAVTFRLADSVPKKVVQLWRIDLADLPDDTRRAKEMPRRVVDYEDAGHGECVLREPAVAAIVSAALGRGDPDSYRLIAWVIMPNHVHVLMKLVERVSLSSVVQKWKGGTALEINRLLGRSGRLWSRDYYDRFIRDENHLLDCIAYIKRNPVKAGLCDVPEDWRFSGWPERGRAD